MAVVLVLLGGMADDSECLASHRSGGTNQFIVQIKQIWKLGLLGNCQWLRTFLFDSSSFSFVLCLIVPSRVYLPFIFSYPIFDSYLLHFPLSSFCGLCQSTPVSIMCFMLVFPMIPPVLLSLSSSYLSSPESPRA